ncbi:2-octaprenyl-6-methoxyphenyl hydroxylase [Oceanicoccus sagamiensis]|uniref:2-octaprenyl-6-methoxyphenyl hydroxylase n=1 Tax=Oceanicoccus sagamiensis TaxID=716816 RepID=UPI001F0A1E70|nr:2-octaprenyl-6-methoxyphenyl hydroxylase [Oceanicoccus sagamiensis]
MGQTAANKSQYDVVIAGGGMVGASLALQLCHHSQQQLRILVVESFPIAKSHTAEAPLYNPSFDARSTALSYSSQLILEPLGVWPLLSKYAAAINSIHVSERRRLGSTMMKPGDVDWPALGCVIENAWLGNVLLNALREKDTIDFLAPASVKHISPQQQGVTLMVEQNGSEKTVAAQLAIIADGANSNLREQLGINARVHSYQQTALIANVSFTKAHQGCAYERFTDQGPMALLPLSDSELSQPRAALVWSLPNDQAATLSECDEAEFLKTLQQRFGHRQGEFIRVGDRSGYPLKLVEAEEQVRSGIVVMGNAAHSLHPVAGQGFNLALRDSARLTQLLVAASQQNRALGDLGLLQQYQQQQQFDQQKTIRFSDQLPGLFTRNQFPLSVLRSIGLGFWIFFRR